MLLLALIAGNAFAFDPPNTQFLVHVAVVHVLKQEHPWGVRAGAEWQFALADHCYYRETDCYSGRIWPVAGPALAVTWRGAGRFAVEVDREVGVADLEMAQFGFLPRWEVVGRVGLRHDFSERAASVVLGGFASKSFGVDVRTRTYGTHGLGLRVDVDTAWVFGDAWRPPTLAAGVWMVASPVGSYYAL